MRDRPQAEVEIWPIFETCPLCLGEGDIFTGHPNDPEPRYDGTCQCCGGSGEVEVESYPVELEDLPVLFPVE